GLLRGAAEVRAGRGAGRRKGIGKGPTRSPRADCGARFQRAFGGKARWKRAPQSQAAIRLQDARTETAFAALLVAGGDGRFVLVAVAVRAAGAVRLMGGVRPIALAAVAARRVQLGHQRPERLLELAAVVVVVGADVAGLLRALLLLVVGTQHGGLD